MPDKYGFDFWSDRGNVRYQCIEPNCDAKGASWEWPENKRMEHHLAHNPTGANILPEDNPGIMVNGHLRRMICRSCEEPFFQERKRGRPRLTCDNCVKE